MTVRTADATTFDERVLGAGKPVLVDFWAQWCAPCRMIAPVLAQIADERAETLSVVQVNYDENPEIGQRYGVLGLPTMLLFRDGEPIRSLVGTRPKARLLAELDGALAEV